MPKIVPSTITPALYGIACTMAPEIIEARWEEAVLSVTRAEPTIHECVFLAYAAVMPAGGYYRNCRRIFMELLKCKDFAFWDVWRDELLWRAGLPGRIVSPDPGLQQYLVPEDELPLQNAVFDPYWHMADDDRYWSPDSRGEPQKHLPYEDAIEIWQKQNPERLKRCRERLQRWLKTT